MLCTKVFGIGLSRTGTTSLNEALNILGIKSLHFPSFVGPLSYCGILKINAEHFDYDGLTDTPVAYSYKKLDKKFPGSKIIFTERDIDSWLTSCEKYKAFRPENQNPVALDLLHKKLYWTTIFDEKLFRKAYEKHKADVSNYFRNREDDLLRINITKGERWERLCIFLDKEIPQDTPFPHSNKSN